MVSAVSACEEAIRQGRPFEPTAAVEGQRMGPEHSAAPAGQAAMLKARAENFQCCRRLCRQKLSGTEWAEEGGGFWGLQPRPSVAAWNSAMASKARHRRVAPLRPSRLSFSPRR